MRAYVCACVGVRVCGCVDAWVRVGAYVLRVRRDGFIVQNIMQFTRCWWPL